MSQQKTLNQKLVVLVMAMLQQIDKSEYRDEVDHDLKNNKAVIDLQSFIIDHENDVEEEDMFVDMREYEFVSKMYNELETAHNQFKAMTIKDKFNINNKIGMEQAKHDMDLLYPIVQKLGFEMLDKFSMKHGIKLKFITRPEGEEKKSNLILSKS